MSYTDKATRFLADAAVCEVRKVEIELRGEGDDRRIAATYELAIDAGGSSRQLVFDHINSPFIPLRIEMDNGRVRDLAPETGERLFAIEPHDEWLSNQLQLRIELRWTESDEEREQPFAIFPSLLPKPAQRTDRTGEYLRAPVQLASDPGYDVEVLGLQRSDGSWDPYGQQQIQLTFVPKRWIVEGTGELVVAAYPKTAGAPTYRTVAQEIRRTEDFVAEELAFAPAMRAGALILEHTKNLLRPPATLIINDGQHFGVTSGDLSILSTVGTNSIAAPWWGAGIQLPGSYGAAVAGGICYYLMLRKLASQGNKAHAGVLLNRAKQQAEISLSPAESLSEWTYHLTLRLGFELFKLQVRGSPIREALATLTHELWGSAAEPSDVLERLRVEGVVVPTWPERYEQL